MPATFEVRLTFRHFTHEGQRINLRQELALVISGTKCDGHTETLVSKIFKGRLVGKTFDQADAFRRSEAFRTEAQAQLNALGFASDKDAKEWGFFDSAIIRL